MCNRSQNTRPSVGHQITNCFKLESLKKKLFESNIVSRRVRQFSGNNFYVLSKTNITYSMIGCAANKQ